MIGHDNVKIKRSHVLKYVHGTPWAITEDKLDAMHFVLNSHLHDKEINISEIEAALGRELNNSYSVVNQGGAAVIPMLGMISKRMNLFQKMSGGVSTELVQRDIAAALEDPGVSKIILRIDSPGGSVDGVKELSDFIYESRGKKPITAFIDSEACSAAYWVASAADDVVAYDTARVGHIGVWMAHYDYSKAYEAEGVKKTYVYAGKYKVMGNETEPLDGEAKDYLQSQVDTYYSLFVDSVARNRGVSTEVVLKEMADGRIFIGKDALKAGLIDRIGGFTGLITDGASRMAAQNNASTKEEKIMNLDELKAAHPELVQAIEASARQGYVMQSQHDVAVAQAAALEAENEKLDTINKDLVKSLSLLEETAAAGLANSIMNGVLAGSDVPENLHAKVMGMVDYHSFVKEGERFAAGSESATAFKTAFEAEVKDWESRLPKSNGVGLGDTKTDDASTPSSLTAYGRDLARQVTGRIRSDKK